MRIFVVLLASALLAVFGPFSGCSKKPARPAAPAFTPTSADVVGTWIVEPSSLKDSAYNIALNQAEEMGIEPSEGDMNAQVKQNLERLEKDPAFITFKEGGVGEARNKAMSGTGTWKLEGDTLTLDIPSLAKPRRFRVTEGTLVSMPETKKGREIYFKRSDVK